MQNIFEGIDVKDLPISQVMLKGVEYYQCAAFVNIRGVNHVLNETRPLVETLKSEGRTFEELVSFVETRTNTKVTLEKDSFLQEVKQMFESTSDENTNNPQ